MGYLKDEGLIWAGAQSLFSAQVPNRLWDPQNPYTEGDGCFCHADKTAET